MCSAIATTNFPFTPSLINTTSVSHLFQTYSNIVHFHCLLYKVYTVFDILISFSCSTLVVKKKNFFSKTNSQTIECNRPKDYEMSYLKEQKRKKEIPVQLKNYNDLASTSFCNKKPCLFCWKSTNCWTWMKRSQYVKLEKRDRNRTL
jgi:hypothetical protein